MYLFNIGAGGQSNSISTVRFIGDTTAFLNESYHISLVSDPELS